MSNTQEETNNEVSEPTELKSDDVPESEAVVHVDNVVQHETRKRKIANSDDNCSESDENIDEDVKDDDEVEISTPSVSAVEEEKKDEKLVKSQTRGDSTLLCKEVNDTLCGVTLNNAEGGSGVDDDDSSICVEENMDEGGDTNVEVDVCSLTSKELRKFKKHQRKLERRALIKPTPNVNASGDFNTTLSNLDKGGKSKHSIDEAYRELNKTICNCNIYDVWRARNESEPLQCMISNNCNISGINIPMSEKVCKMFQHADDTTVTVSDKKSIDEVFNVFELYGKCSGAKMNRQKSEIMPIGKEAGIIQLKDICYEVKPGFLPQNAIVEIVAKGNDEYDIDSIIKRYRSLQSALPELWTNTVGTEVYHRTNNRKIDINLNMNCKLVDFKMCSSKQLYCLVIDKLCQPPKIC
ncbi:unnamed protein product [Mytilus coruscus]|uniref:Reverse transcriptase domain-containing protein n=1 Tax=Mytilus coruscus TaxID=42192 RepID=A0A6J8A4J9_MYTCO|nr:unnamed protein product [Mytilus coruscus]